MYNKYKYCQIHKGNWINNGFYQSTHMNCTVKSPYFHDTKNVNNSHVVNLIICTNSKAPPTNSASSISLTASHNISISISTFVKTKTYNFNHITSTPIFFHGYQNKSAQVKAPMHRQYINNSAVLNKFFIYACVFVLILTINLCMILASFKEFLSKYAAIDTNIRYSIITLVQVNYKKYAIFRTGKTLALKINRCACSSKFKRANKQICSTCSTCNPSFVILLLLLHTSLDIFITILYILYLFRTVHLYMHVQVDFNVHLCQYICSKNPLLKACHIFLYE